MKILIIDKFPSGYIDELESKGHEVSYQPDTKPEQLSAIIENAEILIVRSTKVTSDGMSPAQALKLIIRAGAGTQNIDKKAAQSKNVVVCNVPGANARAVAELTIGLLVAVDRRIFENTLALRANSWRKAEFSKAEGLAYKSIGIVGLGSIGMIVAQMAHALAMRPLAIENPNRPQEKVDQFKSYDGYFVSDLKTLASSVDVLSLHTPLTPSTQGLVTSEVLGAMKDGAILLNTSRGEVVDERALIKELDSGRLRAGVDVFENEPSASEADFVSELASHEKVTATTHIGASTKQAQDQVAVGCMQVISEFLQGRIINRIDA